MIFHIWIYLGFLDFFVGPLDFTDFTGDLRSQTRRLRNVVNADVHIFERFLGHLYFIEVFQICPTELGWPFARPRQFCRMRHRSKARLDMGYRLWTKKFTVDLSFVVSG